MVKFKVFEYNNGTLALFAFKKNDTPFWGHSGYEYHLEDLKKDIAILQKSNFVDLDWEEENGFYDGIGFVEWKDLYYNGVHDAYNDILNDKSALLIADNDSVYIEKVSINVRRFLQI